MLSWTGCKSSSTAGSSGVKQVIGDNDLVPEQDQTLRATVGLLTLDKGVCTAFVTGKNEITTAAHCITEAKSLTDREYYRKLSFRTGTGVTTALSDVADVNAKQDRLVLTTVHSFDKVLNVGKAVGTRLKVVGYDSTPGKQDLYTNEGCKLEKRIPRSGVFTHSCDTIPGMSGAPMLEGNLVVGIHLGYQQAIDRNAAFDFDQINDTSTDVSIVGIANEFGPSHWRCRGCGPIEIPGMNATWSGFILGGPVGALLNDRLAAQRKIEEMRAAGAQREAEILNAKLTIQDQANTLRNLQSSLTCEQARASFVPSLENLYQNFRTALENAPTDVEAGAAYNIYKAGFDATFASAKQVCG